MELDHLEGLTEPQRQAVEHRDGPCLVVAGAGSGKTRVITRRIVHLLRSGVASRRILGLTFTNRAAGEMRERVQAMVPDSQVWLGTFHSFASRVLRQNCERLNLKKDFHICDEDDRKKLLRTVVRSLGIPDSAPVLNLISDQITSAKNSMIGPGKFGLTAQPHQFAAGLVYHHYQWTLRRQNSLDFDDLLNLLALVLTQDEELRSKLDDQYRYIMCDECVPSWTPVMMGDGSSKPIVDVVVGDIVRSYDTKTGTAKNCRVTATQKLPNVKPLVRIKVRHNHKTGTNRKTNFVVCTTDHKIWTINRGWVPAGEIAVGDKVIIETDAKKSPKGKIAASGRDKLRELHIGNTKHQNVKKSRSRPDKFNKNKGGNGRGNTTAQSVLLEALGDGWVSEYILPTGSRHNGFPPHYKIDLAHYESKTAVELDGGSHYGEAARARDAKKDAYLESQGWTVFRFKNKDVAKDLPAILQKVCPDGTRCPRPATVISVDPSYITEHFVYDISVDECHAFYANGILVHNCQDTNPVQFLILRLLTRGSPNIMAVGDPDQSIYKFRNADIRNILQFQQDYKGCRLIKLEHNYRSTPQILQVADSLIRRNRERIEKVLIPTRASGARVQMIGHPAANSEAVWVAEDIEYSVATGRQYADHAILLRIHRLTKEFESALLHRRIPYKVYGGQGFLGRKEVKDILAYCRLAVAPTDVLAFTRAVNEPNRWVGKVTLDRLLAWAEANACPPLAACRAAGRIEGVSRKAADAVARFAELVDLLSTLTDRPGELVSRAAVESGYRQSLVEDPDAGERVEVVDRLCDLARRSAADHPEETLADFLGRMTLGEEEEREEGEEEPDRVKIMTIHGSKGLEFPVVYLPGLEDGILPGSRVQTAEDMEEERRTFFVGITRAMDRLVISAAQFRHPDFCVPSKFLDELPHDEMHIDWQFKR